MMTSTLRFKLILGTIYAILAVCFIGLPFSMIAFGSTFLNQKSPLYPYRSSVITQDEFLSGTTSSGNIGDLGWNAVNGTITFIASETNRPGILRRDTSAVINTITTTQLYQGSSNALLSTNPHTYTYAVRLNTNDANTTMRIGEANAVGGNPPGEGIYFEKLDADTNWFCVTRTGGVQTRNDTGVAVNTNFNTFSYTRNSSGVMFYLNYASVCPTHTTNLTGSGNGPFVQIINSAAASKTHDLDYFEMYYNGMAR